MNSEPAAARWTWVDVVLIALAAAVVIGAGLIAFGVVLVRVSGRASLNSALPALAILSAALEAAGLLGAVYFLGLRRRHFSWAALGFFPVSRRWVVLAAALGVFIIPLSGAIATAVRVVMGLPLDNPQQPFLTPRGLTPVEALAMVALAGVLAPIAEEVFFRGVIYTWLRGRWPAPAAALVSALVFGLVHGEISIAAATFVLGVLLAFVYEESHSLWPGIIIHIVNNTAVLVLVYVTLAFQGRF